MELSRAAPFLVWMTDECLSLSYINPVWKQFTGLSEEDSAGERWLDALHADDRPDVLRTMQEAAQRCAPFGVQCRVNGGSAGERWLLASARFTLLLPTEEVDVREQGAYGSIRAWQ